MPQARPTLSSYPTQPKVDWLTRNRNTTTRDPEDTALSEMVPEEELYQEQDAIGEQGRQRSGPYYIPSRDSLKQSAMAQLRQALGMQRAKAEATAYPEHIKGGYGLREADIKGRYDVQAAQARAEGADERDQRTDQRMRELFMMGQEGQDRRMGQTQAGYTARTQATEQGKNTRQQLGQSEARARAAEGAPDPRWFPGVQDFFGMGESPQAKAAKIRQEAMGQAANEDQLSGQDIAQEVLQQHPGVVDPNQLRGILDASYDFDSPQEMEQVIAAILSRGRR